MRQIDESEAIEAIDTLFEREEVDMDSKGFAKANGYEYAIGDKVITPLGGEGAVDTGGALGERRGIDDHQIVVDHGHREDAVRRVCRGGFYNMPPENATSTTTAAKNDDK